jgi:AcrR family transcriptional regulator
MDPAMARPVNADAAATKQRILESATLFFSEKGKKSSVRDIAQGAGVSLAMVHHYFGSKDDLYGACVDAMYEELAELRAHLTDALAGSPVDTILEDAVRAAFRFARERRTTMRLMMRRVVARGALDEGRVDTFLLPFLEQASTLVSAATGRDPSSLRLPLQSLVFLNGRYAIAEESELMLVTGAPDPEAALRAVEDHLVHHAHQMLGI